MIKYTTCNLKREGSSNVQHFCAHVRSILKAVILYFMLCGMSRDISIAERHRKQTRNMPKSFLKLRVGVYCKPFLSHDLYHLIRWHDRWEIECREDVVSLDLHHHEPKEAVRLLRLQLTYFSGIPGWLSWSSIFYWNEIHKMEWFWFVISFFSFQILSTLRS